jgi:YD repeat-containing protein
MTGVYVGPNAAPGDPKRWAQIFAQMICPGGANWDSQQNACRCPAGTESPDDRGCSRIIYIDKTKKKGDLCLGNPIEPLTGSKRQQYRSGFTVGTMPLEFVYDSSSIPPIMPPAPWDTTGHRPAPQPNAPYISASRAFSPTWYFSLERWLQINHQSSSQVIRSVNAFRGNGRVSNFNTASLVPDADSSARLSQVPQGFLLQDTDQGLIEEYDTSGHLLRVTAAAGQTLKFEYSDSSTPPDFAPSPGYLLKVTGSSGESIGFRYSTVDRRVVITHSSGKALTLALDGGSNISSITWPDNTVLTFHYENAQFPSALTGVTNEAGVRVSTFMYDNEGRAYRTMGAGGVNDHSVSYTSPPKLQVLDQYEADLVFRTYEWVAPAGTTLSMPNQASFSTQSQVIQGVPRQTTVSQPAGSGCAASTSARSYDANGNLASADDFNGNRVCLSNDLSRNLVLSRTEGLDTAGNCSTVSADRARLPVGARKTSYLWHPDWKLPTKVAMPGRMDTFVYNGQPDPYAANATASCAPANAVLPTGKAVVVLCRHITQATTDTTGERGFAAAADRNLGPTLRQWTYNAEGKVLMATDEMGQVTRFSYYSSTSTDYRAGDLQSVTNAKGQVTRFTKHDAHGNVLESVDPNGVTTAFAYDARQRLISQSVAGQSTQYAYDPTGKLGRVTWSDGSFLAYGYDPAQRLTSVSDSQGNRVDYGLDAEGHIVQETSRDPDGVLAAQLSLVRDALGRVQRSTGRE